MSCPGGAVIDPVEPAGVRPARPVVLLDGLPQPRLWVRSLRMRGPVDRRTAVLGMEPAGNGLETVQRAACSAMAGRAVTVVQPVELPGAQAAMLVLFDGVIRADEGAVGGRSDRQGLEAVCDWHRRLEQPWDGQGRATWCLGQWLDRLNELAGLDLSPADRWAEMAQRPVGRSFSRTATVGSVLEGLCRALGLVVVTTMTWTGRAVRVRRQLRSRAAGRRVEMSRQALLAGLSWERPAVRPVQWVGQADGPVVESTFTLLAGWDPAGEGQDDWVYQRSANPQFEQVADVYRLWVLNEDGRLGGDPFDLTGLFDQGRAVAPQPLRFGETLTCSSPGRSLGLVLEVSTDGGLNWSGYGGQWSVLDDRAGIYLSDDLLDGAYLSAVRAGQARVRLTATLASPLPLEQVRWTGNPFAGPFERRLVEFGRSLAWRRVEPGSRFYQAVQSGQMNADQIDQRPTMQQELARRAGLFEQTGTTGEQVIVRLAGPVVGLQPGDRLTGPVPGGLTGTEVLGLVEVEHDWTAGWSSLTAVRL